MLNSNRLITKSSQVNQKFIIICRCFGSNNGIQCLILYVAKLDTHSLPYAAAAHINNIVEK